MTSVTTQRRAELGADSRRATAAGMSRWPLVLALLASPASIALLLTGIPGAAINLLIGAALVALAGWTPGVAEADRALAVAAASVPIFSGLGYLLLLLAVFTAGGMPSLLLAVGMLVLAVGIPWAAASRIARNAGMRSQAEQRAMATAGMLFVPFLIGVTACGIGLLGDGGILMGLIVLALGVGGLATSLLQVRALVAVPGALRGLARTAVTAAAASAVAAWALVPERLPEVSWAALGAQLPSLAALAVLVLLPVAAAVAAGFTPQRPAPSVSGGLS